MAGKAGRSGPPGNLNNARDSWRSFWRRRALKPRHQWVLSVIERHGSSLANEKVELSQVERRVIEVAQVSWRCAMLIIAECAESGLIRKTADGWDLSPGAQELGKFLAVELKALAMLDLERPVSSESDLAGSVAFYIPGKGAIDPR
jgi:hypothetical protein